VTEVSTIQVATEEAESVLASEIATEPVAEICLAMETSTSHPVPVPVVGISGEPEVEEKEVKEEEEKVEPSVAASVAAPVMVEEKVSLASRLVEEKGPEQLEATPAVVLSTTSTSVATATVIDSSEPVVSLEQSIVETKTAEVDDVVVPDEAESIEL
jgi:hypothetical protein